MPYTVDFTNPIHARKRLRRYVYIALLILALAGSGEAIRWLYAEWSRPVVGQRLATYHRLGLHLEHVQQRWEEARSSYEAMESWHRLFGSECMIRTLPVLADSPARLPRNLIPRRATFTTGGACEMSYLLRFRPAAKQRQLQDAIEGLEELYAPWAPEIQWQKDVDLGPLNEMPITVRMRLAEPPHRGLPPPPGALTRNTRRVQEVRQAVRDHAVDRSRRRAAGTRNAEAIMQEALVSARPYLPDDRPATGQNWPDYMRRAVDPGTFMRDLEQAVREAGHPVPEALIQAQNEWDKLALRRWPWRRVRPLENALRPGDLKAMEDLIAAQLPTSAEFDRMVRRIEELKELMARGFDEAAVFHEGEAERALDSCFSGWSTDAWRASVNRAPSRDGLILAPWEVRITAGRETGRTRAVTAEDVASSLRCISDLQYGFVIETLDLEMEMRADRALVITRGTVKGILIVKATAE